MALIKDHVLSSDNVPIYYEVQGDGEPALVFIHGWCCDRSYWREQMGEFAQQYKVVTVDLAGHGESGLDRKAWTMSAFGEDVVAVVESLGLDKVVLIGHSMGQVSRMLSNGIGDGSPRAVQAAQVSMRLCG